MTIDEAAKALKAAAITLAELAELKGGDEPLVLTAGVDLVFTLQRLELELADE